jgi:hypothetical protein
LSSVAPSDAEWFFGGLWMIDTVEICRAMFAGGCVAILLQIFAEVIYGE